MDINFKKAKLAKQCNTWAEGRKTWGERRATLVRKRLDGLLAATTLEGMRNAPGDCHEYKHLKNYTFTLDLDGGWRLFFRPAHDPPPLRADGTSVNWSQVSAVEILEVKEAHE